MYNNCMVYRAEDKSPNVATMFLKMLVVLLPLICSRPAFGQQTDGERVFKAASPSIVTVQSGDSTGTAFLVRDKNTFVTAAHVIEDGAVPVIRHGKGSFLAVRSISYSKALDLAILETEDPFSAKPLALGDKEDLSPGASVFAIGTALGALTNTLTDGMISGSRKAGNVNLVQVSSPFSPGMSGGPVLSKDSKVLGVISFTFAEGQNLNIAVAAKHIRELLADRTRPTELVCKELRDIKTRSSSSEPTEGGTTSPSIEPNPTPSGSENSTPISDAAAVEKNRVEREQALADALSEVVGVVWAATDEAYRIYFDSRLVEDRKLLDIEIDRLQKQLPLVTIAGESNETEISERLARYCTDKEINLLAEKTLSIARAIIEMAYRWKLAIIDSLSSVTSETDRKKSFQQAKAANTRLFGLTDDFKTLIFSLHTREWKISDQLSNKYYAWSATLLGIDPDYERLAVAAVKWKVPSIESNFEVGDVITGLRLSTIPKFMNISNWKDVSKFFSGVFGTVTIEVRVRGRGTFNITITRDFLPKGGGN
jgi:hypothetical protein